MQSNFSVLMSVYYKENPLFFRASIDSILNQTVRPSEIVIVKDGPLSEEINNVLSAYLHSWNILKVVGLNNNMGLGYALKIGLQSCSNELVARMDTDDIAKPYRFEKQLTSFDDDSELAVVGSWTKEFMENVDGGISYGKIRKTPEANKDILQRLKISNAINHPTVMFKKAAVLKAGNYSEEFKYLEDYYLWVRMALSGAKFYNIQEPLLDFRITPDTSKRRGGFEMFRGDVRLHKRFLSYGFITRKEFVMNLAIWSIYRFMPSQLRAFVQNVFLRDA